MSEEVETPRLRTLIAETIDQYLATHGGGFRIAFVYAADILDNDGNSAVMFGEGEGQETYKSIGLTEYMRKWYDEEARDLIRAAGKQCDGACDCEDD